MNLSCPSCAEPLTGAATCPACDLRLTGPDAQRLWQVDQALLALDDQRDSLLVERRGLLAALRAAPGVAGSLTPVNTPAPRGATAAPPPVATAAAPEAARPWPSRPPAPRPEWTPKKVQNTLLGLGALLLAVAATVFAAVTYDRLGAGGRAAVLGGLTLAALGVVPALLRRRLSASAETATGVALVLAALDAYGLRTLGVGDGLEPLTYAAVTCAVLAVGAGAWARAFPLRLPRTAAVVLSQLPVLLLLVRHDASAATTGLVLAGLCAVDLAVLHAARERVPGDVLGVGVGCAGLVGGFGLLAAVLASPNGGGRAALALLAHAAVLGAASVAMGSLRVILSAAPVPLLGLAAWALVRSDLTDVQQPLVAAAVGLLAAQLAALLPRDWRPGPLAGAILVSAVGVLSQLEPLLQALAGPLGWLADPWSLPAGADARSAVTTVTAWSGSVVTLVVLLAAAATLVTAAAALHRLHEALAPSAALVVASAVLLPLGLATSYPTALALLLVVAAALLAAGRLVPAGSTGLALTVTGVVVALQASVWSVASESATLVVLPLVAAGLAVLSAVSRPPAADRAAVPGSVPAAVAVREGSALIAGLVAGAALAAAGAARALSVDQVGALLLAAPAVLLGLSLVARRAALESAAAALALVAVLLTTDDTGWLTWSLALTGLMALAVALRPDRRWAAAGGALLLAGSSWVRLADAGVVSPEPYVVPLGLVALGLGYLRRRDEPTTSSMAAYSPGLSLLLLPSLLYALGDDDLLRPVLLLLVAAGVLVTGVAGRLRAPLLLGSSVLAVDALYLLAPYAAALPRWMPLATVGLALVTLGATYEQRRRDLTALRDRLDAFA